MTYLSIHLTCSPAWGQIAVFAVLSALLSNLVGIIDLARYVDQSGLLLAFKPWMYNKKPKPQLQSLWFKRPK